jgi:hypothetical protein
MLSPQQVSLQIAEKIREIATRQGNVPFRLGDLRKSLVVRPLGSSGAVLGSNLPYARAVHDGRPAVTIRAKNGKALVFWADGRVTKGGRPKPFPKGKAFKQAVEDQELIVRSVVHQPARKGQPFLREAVAELRREGLGWLAPRIGRDLVVELEKALRASGVAVRRK